MTELFPGFGQIRLLLQADGKMFFSRRSGIAAFLKYCPCSRTAQHCLFNEPHHISARSSPQRESLRTRKKAAPLLSLLKGDKQYVQQLCPYQFRTKKSRQSAKRPGLFVRNFFRPAPVQYRLGGKMKQSVLRDAFSPQENGLR